VLKIQGTPGPSHDMIYYEPTREKEERGKSFTPLAKKSLHSMSIFSVAIGVIVVI